MPTIFSCNMMEVTLFLACFRDTVDGFKDLARVILAPNKIKNIKHCKLLGRPGTGELRSTILGVLFSVSGQRCCSKSHGS